MARAWVRALRPLFVVCGLALTVCSAEAEPSTAQGPKHAASAPGPRPPLSAEDAERARRLFEAIVHDDPARCADFFFPREAFLRVKAMRDPGRYYDRLRLRFDADIHALHRSTPDLTRAEFERLEFSSRGGWMAKGTEGNHLPYWAARHARLHYRVGAEARALEVRVLITWEDHWYVIHLAEFH